MAVYVSTRALAESNLAHTLAAYRASGFAHIELSVSHLPPQNVRRLFEGTTETYLVHGAFPPPETPFWLNIAAGDSDVRDKSLRLLKQSLYVCRDIGVNLLSFSPGYALHTTLLNHDHPASGPIPEREAHLHLLRSLDQLANWSDNLGIQLALETQNGLFQEQMIVQPDDWLAIHQALQAPHLGVLLDLGHVKLASRKLKFDPDDAVEGFLPHALACHLHTNDGVSDQHHLPRDNDWEMDQLARPRFAELPVILDAHPLKLTDIETAVTQLEGRLPKPKLSIG